MTGGDPGLQRVRAGNLASRIASLAKAGSPSGLYPWVNSR